MRSAASRSLLCLAALAAGWIDAVVGGGGLLLLPGLPAGTPAVDALGTNKAVAIVGTSGAAVTYARRAPVDVPTAVRIGLAALAGASGGAVLAAGMSTEVLKPVILVVLLGVAAFVILRPSFGTAPAPGPVTRRRVLAAIGLAGLGIGFYDGLVGPGTGTFLVLALTAVLHLDLVTASATAKIVNCCSPKFSAALEQGVPPSRAHRRCVWQGAVLWQPAGLMALFNPAGGTLGAHTALKKGSGFVRTVLLVMVFTLVAKLAYEQWTA
ncbi:putative membrane transporter protein YfcA [Streptomyces sp. enrichment culture]|uniref:sulfite exporter TauE/SafE family protein n=1 Tax=Streptomyces sp. enrichment culture TaxID=1795815 RepID=UPI003F56549C